MANTFISQIEQESADCTTAVLKNYTVYTSPVRGDVATFLKLVKRNAASPPVDTPITIDNSTPLTSSQWTFTMPEGYAGDGWYPATFFDYPKWAAGTYNTNNCVYYVVNERYYRCKSDSVVSVPTTAADWEELTDPTSIETTSSTNVDIGYTHNFTTCKAEIVVGNALETLADQIIDGRPKDWEDAANQLIGLSLLNGAWVKHFRVKNQDAQVIVDFVNQKFPYRI